MSVVGGERVVVKEIPVPVEVIREVQPKFLLLYYSQA